MKISRLCVTVIIIVLITQFTVLFMSSKMGIVWTYLSQSESTVKVKISGTKPVGYLSSEEIQEQRIQTVSMMCETLKSSMDGLSQNGATVPLNPKRKVIVVDEKNKILFCIIAKVGATNWKQLFLSLAGTYKGNLSVHKQPIKLLADYQPKAQMDMLKNFVKIVFVRHPFERLLSAFLDKFIEKPEKLYLDLYGETIRNTANRNGSIGGDLTFDKFVTFLLKKRIDDRHWMTYSDSCVPCGIQYDFIGKIDTLQSDIQYISDTLNMTLDFAKTAGHATGSTNRTSIYFSLLSTEQILGLYKMYYRDFMLFGYSYPQSYLNMAAK
ncbi:carbohydrate sulfotransferase 11-like [Ptychodera flava]|uniref:carbohydrate sulfotransferase 11-like n=1 Tax=Ptychodera flava TaxID=63121 RepID=UPI00396A7497